MSRRFTIGRERSCDVAIADESVSRVHAEIWLTPDGALMMTDRGSSNGSMVMRAGQSFVLNDQVVLPTDDIRFGSVTLPVAELVIAIEIKNPGALTPAGGSAGNRPPMAAPPPIPPPPPLPKPPPAAAPFGAPPGAFPGPPGEGSDMFLRCHCGAIKRVGQLCPGCHR
jgi:hypothetical protein